MTRERQNRPREVVITHGGEQISVAMSYCDGDRLTLSVHPDQRVTATAPAAKSLDQIVKRLRARAGWIVRQRRGFQKFVPLPTKRRYLSGETHLYLGRQYRLRIRQSDTVRVAMRGGFVYVETPRPGDREQVREALERWYKIRAAAVLSRRFQSCLERMRLDSTPSPKVILRRMKRRWGSCTASGRVLLNPELVKVPVQCIDYVIVHELCHRKILRHDRKFYLLLARVMPDWERRKDRLDRVALPVDGDYLSRRVQ